MSDVAPQWLLKMRSMNGLSEKPGSPDETKILAMADEIAAIFPDMKSYCDQYNHDSIPWCGLTVANCVATYGIRPPFVNGSDTDCFLWAKSWADDSGYTILKSPVWAASSCSRGLVADTLASTSPHPAPTTC